MASSAWLGKSSTAGGRGCVRRDACWVSHPFLDDPGSRPGDLGSVMGGIATFSLWSYISDAGAARQHQFRIGNKDLCCTCCNKRH